MKKRKSRRVRRTLKRAPKRRNQAAAQETKQFRFPDKIPDSIIGRTYDLYHAVKRPKKGISKLVCRIRHASFPVCFSSH